MAVRIVKSVSESVGARRASALSETEAAELQTKTSVVVPDPEVTGRAERRQQKLSAVSGKWQIAKKHPETVVNTVSY